MIKSIQVGSSTYNVARASAVKQKTLMTLIAAKVAMNSATSDSDIDVRFLTGALLAIDEQTLDKVSEIVLYKTVKSGGDELVSLDNWGSGMSDYFRLIAEAVYYNLSDFFMLLDADRKAAKHAAKPASDPAK